MACLHQGNSMGGAFWEAHRSLDVYFEGVTTRMMSENMSTQTAGPLLQNLCEGSRCLVGPLHYLSAISKY
ncbi:hypothetical protein CsSME_00048200 [Camellia sinensis var. sinensis]